MYRMYYCCAQTVPSNRENKSENALKSMVSKRKQIGQKKKGVNKALPTRVKTQAKELTKPPTGTHKQHICSCFYK